MVRKASTAGDTRSVDRRVISSGSSLEERFGYSRAVVTSDRVYVAGTAPIMPGDADPPTGPYEQMRRCLEIVGGALAEAGAAFDDVVRTRVFLTDRDHVTEAMRAHGEAFGGAAGVHAVTGGERSPVLGERIRAAVQAPEAARPSRERFASTTRVDWILRFHRSSRLPRPRYR
jgi:enamine deaminase RidA (YjgF/YER057c/UK114 family)